jgi:hypothetical protein
MPRINDSAGVRFHIPRVYATLLSRDLTTSPNNIMPKRETGPHPLQASTK